MRMRISRMLGTAALAATLLTGCNASAENESTVNQQPPPWSGTPELQLSEFQTLDDGSRITVHQISHRATTMHMDQESTGLAAEIEFCAGGQAADPGRLSLLSESLADWQGTSVTMYGQGGVAMIGLEEPRINLSSDVQSGECERGWIDFLNIYGEHGDPIAIGYDHEADDVYEAMWPAKEPGAPPAS